MKGDAWECGHRMPFIVRWPGKVRSGSVSDQTICFTDMLATFASVVGVDLPQEAGPDSFNLLPVLLEEQRDAEPVRNTLVTMSAKRTLSIQSGEWKLIPALGSRGFSEPALVKPRPGSVPGQLYNLANDLGETKNLYAENPAIVKQLTNQLAKIRDSGRSR